MKFTRREKVLLGVIQDIYWMARRYADGRQTYAVSMYNDALIEAMTEGFVPRTGSAEGIWAADGDPMFHKETK